MQLKKIKIKNYKPFKEEIEFEIKPITILIGKNSAGKSALARLPILLLESYFNSSHSKNPFLLNAQGLDFGNSFTDLIYGQNPVGNIHFFLNFIKNDNNLELENIIQNYPDNNQQLILKQRFFSSSNQIIFQKSLDPVEPYRISCNNTELEGLDISFNGLYPFYHIKNITGYENANLITKKYTSQLTQIDINYVPPVREEIERYYIKNDVIKINQFIGKVPYLLANDYNLANHVGNWYQNHMNEKIEVNNIDTNRGFFEIIGTNNGTSINLKDMGYGLGQSLPIVTLAHMERNGIDIIEQPELHLHPAAHGDIAELLVNSANENPEAAFIVETHSENFILRVRTLIAKGILRPDDLALYWVDKVEDENYSTITKIDVSEKGSVSFWPEGVFSEDFEEVRALRQAQRQIQT